MAPKRPRRKPSRLDRLSGAFQRSHIPRELLWDLPEPIYVMNESGQLVDANGAYLELLGVEDLDQARSTVDATMWVDRARRDELIERVLREGQYQDAEVELSRADGEVRTVLDTCITVSDPETGVRLLYGLLVDITQHKQVERELRRLLIRDPLTGCFNRRYLEDLPPRLEPEAVWGAIVVDIDEFKHYNDQFGHDAGDAILVRFARFLAHRLRPADAVIRMGGDEFLVLLFGNDTNYTEMVATRFKQAAATAGAPVPFSLGWAVRERGETLQETIIRADRQLIHVRIKERRRSTERRAPPDVA